MGFTSGKFWDAVFCKLVETLISVKIWILCMMVFFVNRLYCVNDELRAFMLTPVATEIQKWQILTNLQGKLYDIGTTLILSGVVVIVLSRVTFQHAKLKNGSPTDKESTEAIKNNFA